MKEELIQRDAFNREMLTVGTRFKFWPELRTIWQVLEIQERGVVTSIFSPGNALHQTHESLETWDKLRAYDLVIVHHEP